MDKRGYGTHQKTAAGDDRFFRLAPMARAIAIVLAAGTMMETAQAQQAFSPAWFAAKGAAQSNAAATGYLPNGTRAALLVNPAQQQQQANAQLRHSLSNLSTVARAIAAQQAAQEAARQAALANGGSVPDGLAEGGLKVDTNSLTRGWINASAPTQSSANGQTTVSIAQSADKAILNWASFNVGKNTILNFSQQANWSVLNRVNDPLARPSQIQGQINAPGTVLIVNRNGIVFSGSSQVNTRNLVAAAAQITDAQFNAGLYGANGNTPSFTDADGKLIVQAGASLNTARPASVTTGGGYVLLMGQEVENAGSISTPRGQVELAAGNSFIIRKGYGSDGNTSSTTRGNEIAPQRSAGSSAGKVLNTGLLVAAEGDVTLAGHDVQQRGAILASTTVNNRGTIHLLNSAGDAQGSVTLGAGAVTAVLIEDDGKSTALDSQRDALVSDSAKRDTQRPMVATGVFDNLSTLADRGEQSRVEIVSGGNVRFEAGSLTLATGGQVATSAARRAFVADGARLDVAGAVGVQLAMDSNNIKVNVQGNELRDAPLARDGGKLINSDVWVDLSQLVYVPAGVGGYAAERWYTAGGLLEVGGYLANRGNRIGQWAAQGGTVVLAGNEVVTQSGSIVNVSGGTLDVQTGYLNVTWLRGADGRLYRADSVSADVALAGVYRGFEVSHARWGKAATEYYYNPLIAPQRVLQNGYTVGRDAGRLIVSAPTAVLEGQIVAEAFNGPRQSEAPAALADGYRQSYNAASRRGGLSVGRIAPSGGIVPFNSQIRVSGVADITAAMGWQDALDGARANTVWLDAARINAMGLGELVLQSRGGIVIGSDLVLSDGGTLSLLGPNVEIAANVTAHGGQLQASNLVKVGGTTQALTSNGGARFLLREGAAIDLSGRQVELQADPLARREVAFIQGGKLAVAYSHDVTLQAGSLVDVSSGVAVLENGSVRGGRGGDVSLVADSAQVAATGGKLTLGARLAAYGVKGGGKLALETGNQVVIGTQRTAAALNLRPELFSAGFSSYDINGHAGLRVADGVTLEVFMPQYRYDPPADGTGAGRLVQWTPALYQEDPLKANLRQRSGASLSLQSIRLLQSAEIAIGKGALVAVDPGQSIALIGNGQITVEGRLNAWGGSISIDDVRSPTGLYEGTPHNRSIWIGEQAVLDVAGRSASATDARGRRYGVVQDGGTISIGSALDWEAGSVLSVRPPDQHLVLRPGALLDASGASAVFDVPGQGAPVTVAGNGGSIILASANSMHLDGSLRAAAGGAGAAGGTLGLVFQSGMYLQNQVTPATRTSRTLVLGQLQGTDSLGAGARPGDTLAYGQARLGADRIAAGGFDNLSLFAALQADGDLSLPMRQSLRLWGPVGVVSGAASGRTVSLSAPYLSLGQALYDANLIGQNYVVPGLTSEVWRKDSARLSARLIDVQGQVNWIGFDDVALRSQGDIRLRKGLSPTGSGAPTLLVAPHLLTLAAAQIYPETRVSAVIGVGRLQGGTEVYSDLTDRLVIERVGSQTPDMPLSVLGSLQLSAGVIEQGGVVRAPLGSILFGSTLGSDNLRSLHLLPGSITSVSGAGLTIPYGGTVDGIKYLFNGAEVEALPVGGDAIGTKRQVEINALAVQVEQGALIDLSGGGDLRGAGFVSGRGGSVDILRTSLANANPTYGFSRAGDAVYAIVPGHQYAYAPTGNGDTPAPAGRQVTIGAGVPGLPAGTYTLLPAAYALLPGAFRVELGAVQSSPVAVAASTNAGSYVTSGRLSVANTDIRAAQDNRLLLTPADAVRKHSGYNETGYDAFFVADAVRRQYARPMLTVDAAGLSFNFGRGAGMGDTPALRFEGRADFAPAANSQGFGGMLAVRAGSSSGLDVIQLMADGQRPLPGMTGAALYASQLNAFGADRIIVGGRLMGPAYGSSSASYSSQGGGVILRNGALLQAPEVALLARGGGNGVIVEQGATISTVGRGKPGFDSSNGYFFSSPFGGALVVSNGWINLLPAEGSGSDTVIDLGGCLSACQGQARLLSEGVIGVATNGNFSLRDTVSYGTRNLVLSMSAINLGSRQALARAGADGRLPPGMMLNQQVLGDLLRGNTELGTPALASLVLNARESVNIFGAVEIDTLAAGASQLQRLVFGAPAIYGYGAAGDTATIRTGEFIWAGTTSMLPAGERRPGGAVPVTPGAAMLDRLGGGTLNVNADTIRFDYAPNSRPVAPSPNDRLALGFSTVNLNAGTAIVAGGNEGSLYVYRNQAGYTAGQGWRYVGGDLRITTPLLTGGAGAGMSFRAGDVINVAGTGVAAAAGGNALGASMAFQAETVRLDTAVVLPSGKLTLTATRDVTLGPQARIDLSGRAVNLFDVQRYSWGGDLALSSEAGNVTVAAGALIDLSARNNRGGHLAVTALGEGAGRVTLAGAIRGGGSGYYASLGSIVPFDAGQLTLRAQVLDDFAGLNARLNEGALTGARRFLLKQGSLVVGNEVKAREVQIAVDGGSLAVNGKIDASGYQVGAIRLSARDDLVINGVLDAHASGARLDSYGKLIDAPNRATVELSTRNGTLVVAGGAVIDLRAATESSFADGRARGTLDLNAPRRGGNDVAIDVRGPVDIRGAKSVAVYGFVSYADAPLADLPDVSGERPQLITKGFLDTIDGHSRSFINAALANPALSARLAGLGRYSLRPGVEIVSNPLTNPKGNLTVVGDIDLSNYRYGPQSDPGNPARRGFGEPGALVLRAAGDLNIFGSINDGFAPPPETLDDNGWLLTKGRDPSNNGLTPFGGDIVVPIDGIKLEAGTTYPAGATLNYDIKVRALNLPAGSTVPVPVTLAGNLELPAGLVLSADVTTAQGVRYPAGTLLPTPLSLGAGARLGAGFSLRSEIAVAAMTWPRGVKLPSSMVTSEQTSLLRGALIPSMTKVELAGDQPVNLRPVVGGSQGANWALAPMLPEGTTSWNLTAVAGADIDSSDVRARNVWGRGDIVLADTHYGRIGKVTTRYESGSGILILTRQGALGLVGDAAVEGMTMAEADAWMRATWGLGWSDMFGDMTMEAACASGVGFCATKSGPKVFTMEGAMGLIGVPDVAGMTFAQVDAWMRANWSMSWADMFGGSSFDDVCGFSPGYCIASGGEPPKEIKEYDFAFGSPNFSVLRTGAGDLSLLAGRDVRMMSLYGVYTAGQQSSLPGVDNSRFNRPRGYEGKLLLGDIQGSTKYDAALAAWKAWYPDQGGNLLVDAGRNLIGDSLGAFATNAVTGGDGASTARFSSAAVSNWLWRQGSGDTAGVDPVDSAWWINFGAYARAPNDDAVRIVGFTGFGALGGGNVKLVAQGDAGLIEPRGEGMLPTNVRAERSQGLVAAVGSTGRVIDGQLVQTGGGDLDIRIGGKLNPNAVLSQLTRQQGTATTRDHLDLNGVLTNLRGGLNLYAGSVGAVTRLYGDGGGLRPSNPFAPGASYTIAAPVLMLGDATARLDTRGDLVLAGAGDPGRVRTPTTVAYANNGTRLDGWGNGWFSLWTANSAINLFSAGGNITPMTTGDSNESGSNLLREGVTPDAYYFIYPSILRAVAASGDIHLSSQPIMPSGVQPYDVTLLLAPSRQGQLEMLAGGSIGAGTGSPYRIAMSGADTVLPGPFKPAFAQWKGRSESVFSVSNLSAQGTNASAELAALFVFGGNTTLSASPHAADPVPARLYAVGGDIVGINLGLVRKLGEAPYSGTRSLDSWYEAATAVQLRAGGDILGSNVVALNNGSQDVSLMQAGRDIVQSSFTVAGPGMLEVSAGRQLRLDDVASLRSLGAKVAGDSRPGAAVVLGAGMTGVDWAALRARYLDPANLADTGTALADQPGKVVKTYQRELAAWLAASFGQSGSDAQNLAYFDGLSPELQHSFLRTVYFDELRAGGREYNEAEGPRAGSYLRGRRMISTLFPETDASGRPIRRSGDIVMYGKAGVHTDFGGDIDMLAPAGKIVVGIQGELPPASAGVMTQGAGNISIFSQGNLLLGLSRIMTTFGGNILAWSAQGDINAGRGAKTTVLFTPPRRAYDDIGNVALAPQAPSSGAGIATLNPISEVAPGDVDLIAPLGTIDAGEAGIRVSGNINIAALQVVNAANIQVQGKATGLPVVAAVNVGALANASTAASSAAMAAQESLARERTTARQNLPSVFTVRVLGFGGEQTGGDGGDGQRPRAGNQANAARYDSNHRVQVLGHGRDFNPELLSRLSQEQRRQLQQEP